MRGGLIGAHAPRRASRRSSWREMAHFYCRYFSIRSLSRDLLLAAAPSLTGMN